MTNADRSISSDPYRRRTQKIFNRYLGGTKTIAERIVPFAFFGVSKCYENKLIGLLFPIF